MRNAPASFSTARPVFDEMLTRGAQGTRASSRLDLAVELLAAILVDQIPLVEGDHEGPSGIDDGRR